jgi:hypothetical protein
VAKYRGPGGPDAVTFDQNFGGFDDMAIFHVQHSRGTQHDGVLLRLNSAQKCAQADGDAEKSSFHNGMRMITGCLVISFARSLTTLETNVLAAELRSQSD